MLLIYKNIISKHSFMSKNDCEQGRTQGGWG